MRAFITGITGQDGFYLAELLNNKGYEVHGLARRSAQSKVLPHNVKIHIGDVQDSATTELIADINPDEVYNLAAMSHVGESFNIPRSTFEINALGTLNALEGAKKALARFYQASTSELYGNEPPPQNETTRFYPRSPYGVAKLAAFYLTVNYREAYGMHTSNGILFNHESPLRGEDFVTKKIAQGVARVFHGDTTSLKLGNLEAKRDWGHAKDYVKGMWLMLQHEPDDFVLATGKTHTVREFAALAFQEIDEDYNDHIEIDPNLYRPAEVDELCGDYSKAYEKLGWQPEVTFRDLVKEMVNHEISNFDLG